MFVHYLSGMQKPWDIENWDRKSAYEFFKTFEDPYVGIQVNLDCTAFVQQCKMHSYSTHHALLYAVVKAANIYEPMRLRRTEDGVALHDAIDIGCSVMKRGMKAFVFAYYPWVEGESVADFIFRAQQISVQAAKGIPFEDRPVRTNLIYGTTLPWLSFTGFKHPRKGGNHSIPKIVLGKIPSQAGRYILPFQLEVDHALMDGIHMSEYLALAQENLNRL